MLTLKRTAAKKEVFLPYLLRVRLRLGEERFRKELTLTDDQTREVAEVLDDFVKYYQTLQAQMDDVRANGKDRIVNILNPEQRDKFSRMMTELQSRQQIK